MSSPSSRSPDEETPEFEDPHEAALAGWRASMAASLNVLRKKHPENVGPLMQALRSQTEYHEYLIMQHLSQALFDRASSVSQRERDRIEAQMRGPLDGERSFDALSRYAQRLELRIKQRLRTRSRKYWYLLFARLLPLTRQSQESRWSEVLVERTIDLAIAKFGKTIPTDVEVTGRQSWVPVIDEPLVVRLLEIINLCRELYYATASMRRTAKGGILQYGSWTVENDPETSSLISSYDRRSSESTSSYADAGIFVPTNGQNTTAIWSTTLAADNLRSLVWPLRTSLASKELVRDSDRSDPKAYVPNYLYFPKDYGAAFTALTPYRASLEALFGFRLEDLFAAISTLGMIPSEHQIFNPGLYVQMQRTGYLISTETLIEQRFVRFIPQFLQTHGIPAPLDMNETAARVRRFLTLHETLTIDLLRRKPLKPLIPLSATEVRVDYRLLRHVLLEPFRLLPTLTEDDNQTRSDDFERILHQQILDAVPTATSWRVSSIIQFSDIKEEIDSGILIDDVLLVSECKARSVGDKMELAAPTYLTSLWRTSTKYIKEIDDLAEALCEKQIVNTPSLPNTVRFILPVVVEPHAEYVPTEDRHYWVVPDEIPRVMTVSEVIEIAKRLAAGDRSLSNLRAIQGHDSEDLRATTNI